MVLLGEIIVKILFIGGSGNISLASSLRLLEQGHELWLLNRSGHCAELIGAHYIQADINDAAQVKSQLQDHQWDVVVNWIAFTKNDVARDVALFTAKTQQYVFISSASCYQNPGPSPIITEKTPLANPLWQYSRDKIAAEEYLLAAYKQADFPVTIVRPSHTYARVIPLTIGGWTEYTAVARMKAGKPIVVQGDGYSLWTLTHADDFAVGFCGLLGNPLTTGEDYHITSDKFLSWNEIYQQTAAAVGVEAKIVHVTSDKICTLDNDYTGSLLGDKSVSAIFDNSKIRSIVPEFNPQITYAKGIQQVINWFEADKARQIINPKTDAFIDLLIASA
jgi:nucleoside-diphosphate-sugar epimerase